MPDEKSLPQNLLEQHAVPAPEVVTENAPTEKSQIQTLYEDPTLEDRQAEEFVYREAVESLVLRDAMNAEHYTTRSSRTREEQDFYERILQQAEDIVVRRRQLDTMLTELRVVRELASELLRALPDEKRPAFKTSTNVAFSRMFSPALLQAASVEKPSTLLEDPSKFGRYKEGSTKRYDNMQQREGFVLALDSQLAQNGIDFGSFITEVSEEESPIEFTDLVTFADNYAALGHSVSEAALTAAEHARKTMTGSGLKSRLSVLKKVYAKGRMLTVRGNAVLDQAASSHRGRLENSETESVPVALTPEERIEREQAVETYELATKFSSVLSRPEVKTAFRDALGNGVNEVFTGMLNNAQAVAEGSIRELAYDQIKKEAQTRGRAVEDITEQELGDRVKRYMNPEAIGTLDAHADGIKALNIALRTQQDLSPAMVDKVTGMLLAAQYMSRLPDGIKPHGDRFSDVLAAQEANALGDKSYLQMIARNASESAIWSNAFDRLGRYVVAMIAELPEVPDDVSEEVKLKIKQTTRPGKNLVSPLYNPAVVSF